MTLHRSQIGFTLARTFKTLSFFLLVSEPVSNTSPAQVIGAQLDLDPITRQNSDVVHPHLARYVGQNLVPVLEIHTELSVGQGFGYRAFYLYGIFFSQGPPQISRLGSLQSG
jgi:hypothetical protein